jgi:RNA-binding protein
MSHLTGAQKKYLRGLAHNRKPVVLIGQKYLTPQVVREIRQALEYHELIKVKCIGPKEKDDKKEIAIGITQETGCELVGMIGHILIFFKQHPDPEKRKVNPQPPLAVKGSKS